MQKTIKAKINQSFCPICFRSVTASQGWRLRGYKNPLCASCLKTRAVTSEVMILLESTRKNAHRQSRRIQELTEQRNFYRQLCKNKVCRCKGKQKLRASKEEIERELDDLDARILRGEV